MESKVLESELSEDDVPEQKITKIMKRGPKSMKRSQMIDFDEDTQ